MPFTYYEAIAKEACNIAQEYKAEEDITGKYLDFIDNCMEKADGDIVGKYLEGRSNKTVVIIAPPFYFDGAGQIVLNDILEGKICSAPTIIRLYRIIALEHKGLSNKNCLFMLAGYSKSIEKKEEYLKIFKVITELIK